MYVSHVPDRSPSRTYLRSRLEFEKSAEGLETRICAKHRTLRQHRVIPRDTAESWNATMRFHISPVYFTPFGAFRPPFRAELYRGVAISSRERILFTACLSVVTTKSRKSVKSRMIKVNKSDFSRGKLSRAYAAIFVALSRNGNQ